MPNLGGRGKSQASTKSTMHVRTIEVVLDDGQRDERPIKRNNWHKNQQFLLSKSNMQQL